MMIQTVMRTWSARLAMLSPMLSPTWLVDRFLDWLDEICEPMLPAPAERLARLSMTIKPQRDRYGN